MTATASISNIKAGSTDIKLISETIKSIEFITKLYKKRRMSTEKYIQQMNSHLSKLSNERDYLEYLKNIGQF